MASAAVRTAFRSALQAAYPTSFYETLNVAPDLETMPPLWLTIQFPGGAEHRASLGDVACYRETGQVEIAVFSASGIGDGDAVTLADEVRDLFRSKQLTPEVRAVDADPPLHIRPDAGDYFAAIVSVSYVFDFFQ